MSSLSTIRANVRKDLRDEDATNQRWTDAVLDRHIQRALREYSMVSPLEKKTTLTTDADARTVGVSSLVPRLRIVAVEYPTGEFPRSFTPFSEWADVVTLDVEDAPSGTPDVIVYWHGPHTINGTISFPATDDDIVATGAAAFAALEWASFATNRVNVGGESVWGMYMDFAQVRLAEFREQLRRLPAANRLRTGMLFRPELSDLRTQSSDPGP